MHPVNAKLCAQHGKTNSFVHPCCVELCVTADGSSDSHIIQILPFFTESSAIFEVFKIDVYLFCLIQKLRLPVKILYKFMSAEEIIYEGFFQKIFICY